MSLWDMLHLFADGYTKACIKLGGLNGLLFTLSLPRPLGDELPTEVVNDYQLPLLREALSELKLRVSASAVDFLINRLKAQENIKVSELNPLIQELSRTLCRELEGRTFFTISESRANYYRRNGTILGMEAICRLPGLMEDASEAGDCFALGRYTACVFHLMRIMEVVVREFAVKVRATKKDGSFLDVKNEDWYQIEQAIKRSIDTMPKGDSKDKYSASLASLSAVRAGWRNPTMHPKQTYTEEEAKILMDCVSLFVRAFLALP